MNTMNKPRWYLPITIVFLFLGIMLSLQFQAQTRYANDLTLQKTENLIAMVRGLSEKRQKLALEIIDLSNQLRSQLESSQDEQKLLESIQLETEKLEIVNGTVEHKGPGITVTIEDYMPIYYTDILNILNELWNAGAEAISINEHRVTSHTTISSVKINLNTERNPLSEDFYMPYITVNHRVVEYPIVMKAIGDPNNLEKALTFPGGIMDKLALFDTYPVITKMEELIIPADQSSHIHFFVSEYKPEEEEASKNNADSKKENNAKNTNAKNTNAKDSNTLRLEKTRTKLIPINPNKKP
ncbi:MAG TPA: DUF881 domain-containing protein [Clostridia bacterium]|nr:DUF881 domain-containing protein [Clostridia bacterium]